MSEQHLEAVAWERAPRYPGRKVNHRIVCADGFAVSVQASSHHYANDSSGGEAPYWRGEEEPIEYPFTTFEIGNPSEDLPSEWEEWDSGGVWAWVPYAAVADLLAEHGGSTGWEGGQRPPPDPPDSARISRRSREKAPQVPR